MPLPQSLKRIVIAWMVLLPATFVFTYVLAEPYPTFIMPGFARVYHQGEDAITSDEPTVVVTCADRSVHNVPFVTLLGDLHGMNPLAVMKNEFTSSHLVRTSVDTTSGSWYQRFKLLRYHMQEWVSGGMHGMYGRATDNKADDPRTAAWLMQRLATILPGAEPREVFIRWTSRTRELRDTAMVVTADIQTDSLRIMLNNPQ